MPLPILLLLPLLLPLSLFHLHHLLISIHLALHLSSLLSLSTLSTVSNHCTQHLYLSPFPTLSHSLCPCHNRTCNKRHIPNHTLWPIPSPIPHNLTLRIPTSVNPVICPTQAILLTRCSRCNSLWGPVVSLFLILLIQLSLAAVMAAVSLRGMVRQRTPLIYSN
jgi:hypothetical protein